MFPLCINGAKKKNFLRSRDLPCAMPGVSALHFGDFWDGGLIISQW